MDLATISLPASISNVTAAIDINLAFTLYTQSTLFPIRDSNSIPDTVVGSSVISASVDGIADGTALFDNVIVNLRILVEVSLIIRLSLQDFNVYTNLASRMLQIIVVSIGIFQLQVNYSPVIDYIIMLITKVAEVIGLLMAVLQQLILILMTLYHAPVII